MAVSDAILAPRLSQPQRSARVDLFPAVIASHVIVAHPCRVVLATNSTPPFSKRCIVSETFPPNERTRVIREPQRGKYDRETIYKILDEGLVCHVGFTAESQPYAIPTMLPRSLHYVYGQACCD